VQRVGGWGVPCVVEGVELDESDNKGEMDDEQTMRKLMGYRDVLTHIDEETGERVLEQRESETEYALRVAGIMRVYFLVLVGGVSSASSSSFGGAQEEIALKNRQWHPSRIWTYLARIVNESVGDGKGGLGSAVAAEVVYSAFFLLSSPNYILTALPCAQRLSKQQAQQLSNYTAPNS
jgi:nucleoporin GLE1